VNQISFPISGIRIGNISITRSKLRHFTGERGVHARSRITKTPDGLDMRGKGGIETIIGEHIESGIFPIIHKLKLGNKINKQERMNLAIRAVNKDIPRRTSSTKSRNEFLEKIEGILEPIEAKIV